MSQFKSQSLDPRTPSAGESGTQSSAGAASELVSHKRKWTSLEIADQMYKEAFLVKKTRFSHLHPGLTEAELHQMTVDFFKSLD